MHLVRSLATAMALALATAFALPAQAPAADKIVLLGNAKVPPKAYLDGEAPKGFAVDAAIEAFKRAGYEVEVQLYPWQRAYAMASKGEGFITGLSKSPERETIFLFSEPLVIDEVIVVTAKEKEFPFKSYDDLAGKTVAYQQGANFGPEFAANKSVFKEETDSDPAGRLRKLLAGRLDAVLLNPGRAALKINANEARIDPASLSVLEKPLAVTPNFLGVAKTYPGATDILARVNAAIAGMEADGTMAHIMKAYE